MAGMRCRGLLSVLALAFSVLVGNCAGARLRRSASSGRNSTGMTSRRAAKVQLPSECSVCGSGMIDPFMEEAKYCRELYSQCDCCRENIEGRKNQICSQFMGYGDCVAGIEAAIERKKAQCKQQQDLEDYNENSRRQEIRDKLGYDPFDLHAVTSNSTSGLGPYEEACTYGDPNCKDNKALCAFSYGCNRRLYNAEQEYNRVKGWYELYTNTPCFR